MENTLLWFVGKEGALAIVDHLEKNGQFFGLNVGNVLNTMALHSFDTTDATITLMYKKTGVICIGDIITVPQTIHPDADLLFTDNEISMTCEFSALHHLMSLLVDRVGKTPNQRKEILYDILYTKTVKHAIDGNVNGCIENMRRYRQCEIMIPSVVFQLMNLTSVCISYFALKCHSIVNACTPYVWDFYDVLTRQPVISSEWKDNGACLKRAIEAAQCVLIKDVFHTQDMNAIKETALSARANKQVYILFESEHGVDVHIYRDYDIVLMFYVLFFHERLSVPWKEMPLAYQKVAHTVQKDRFSRKRSAPNNNNSKKQAYSEEQ